LHGCERQPNPETNEKERGDGWVDHVRLLHGWMCNRWLVLCSIEAALSSLLLPLPFGCLEQVDDPISARTAARPDAAALLVAPRSRARSRVTG
jgi:hypothetical protein